MAGMVTENAYFWLNSSVALCGHSWLRLNPNRVQLFALDCTHACNLLVWGGWCGGHDRRKLTSTTTILRQDDKGHVGCCSMDKHCYLKWLSMLTTEPHLVASTQPCIWVGNDCHFTTCSIIYSLDVGEYLEQAPFMKSAGPRVQICTWNKTVPRRSARFMGMNFRTIGNRNKCICILRKIGCQNMWKSGFWCFVNYIGVSATPEQPERQVCCFKSYTWVKYFFVFVLCWYASINFMIALRGTFTGVDLIPNNALRKGIQRTGPLHSVWQIGNPSHDALSVRRAGEHHGSEATLVSDGGVSKCALDYHSCHFLKLWE